MSAFIVMAGREQSNGESVEAKVPAGTCNGAYRTAQVAMGRRRGFSYCFSPAYSAYSTSGGAGKILDWDGIAA